MIGIISGKTLFRVLLGRQIGNSYRNEISEEINDVKKNNEFRYFVISSPKIVNMFDRKKPSKLLIIRK